MTGEDPRRLKAGEAPPELARALELLGRSDRDAARLARVAPKLGAALSELPPPLAAGASSANLLGSKIWIASIVAGIAAASLFGYLWSTRPGAPVLPRPPALATSNSGPEARPLPQPEPTAPPPAARARARATEPSPPSRESTPVRRSVRPAPSPAAAAPAGATGPSAPAVVTADAPSDSSAEPSETAPRAARSEPKEPAAIAAPPTEVELLFGARKAVSSQPMAALRLLDEHAALYPRGQLAPEREVLRIEALRKLGRTAEAAQRLREFQARYPKSIHLRRLAGAAGSGQAN